MRLSKNKIETLCRQKGIRVGEMLNTAGVSRNAFYSLARKKTIIPRSVIRIAENLGVQISDLLEESLRPTARMRKLRADIDRIIKMHHDADRDNVRHTLLLLDEKPVERLRRSLRRGRSFNFR